jgi:hypothetical protein
MADENMNAMIPNLEYRLFMLQLSHHFSPEDMEELKYVSAIPRGIGEKLMSQSIPWLPIPPPPGVCRAFSTVLVPRVGHLLSAG